MKSGQHSRGAGRISQFSIGDSRFVVVSLPVRGGASGANVEQHDGLEQLTRTERELVTAVVSGRSNRTIAAERGRSPRTIANQIHAIFKKLGACSRAELVALCLGDPSCRR